MGESATRITAQDFVTAPELAGLSLANHDSGRIGGVRLELVSAGSKTRLASCYQQVPLRVHQLDLGTAQPALVYLLNPTAGLFDGDAHLVKVHAGRDTRAFVTGQSATRIHPCLHGYSTQQWQICLDAGAIMVVLPGPALPFQGCRYYQRVVVNLAEGAHLIWGDLWLPGRYARGAESERFRFRMLMQDLTVYQAGRLVFRDRFCWQGPWDEATAAWHFGGADAYGSLFSTVTEAPKEGTTIETDDTSKKLASFQTAEGHMCLRWLGPVQSVTAALTRRALTLAANLEGGKDPWLLAAHDLAPNHWFSPCG
jgi:urease accessory protein